MAVGYQQLPPLLPVAGVELACAAGGVKYPNRDDITLFRLAVGSRVVGLFTQNAFCAAPVQLTKTHLHQSEGAARYLLINTGNANAGTGSRGMVVAAACCRAVAELAGCAPEAVLPFSTGVIGEDLPYKRAIVPQLPQLLSELSASAAAWERAAAAIMTTDTVAKGCSRQITLQGRPITITGIAKGSGMIRPDMATMLAFIATDAEVERAELQQLANRAVKVSFNRVTVDGDTSTNDSCLLIATGASGVSVRGEEELQQLQQALIEVMQQLAQLLVRDGEGATKFITLEINQALSEAEAEQVGFTIAHSPLVKTALFASDANWGRILAAIGRSGLPDFDIARLTIAMNGVLIVANGGRADSYREQEGAAAVAQSDITLSVNLGRGEAQARIYSCDLSYDYVRINADYRS
ncbi:bifunctional glutamate N-acetyltransferase/amino-acid acetyltransferase ArgJ [Ectothiorhodospiraceae bacterium BW-2]|nr:bifunctional glutamate N-acetyltransferase/amino-acid acetyltransferase ArgJ [Ectothiorhodospiraceae bacterium BW-2]